MSASAGKLRRAEVGRRVGSNWELLPAENSALQDVLLSHAHIIITRSLWYPAPLAPLPPWRSKKFSYFSECVHVGKWFWISLCRVEPTNGSHGVLCSPRCLPSCVLGQALLMKNFACPWAKSPVFSEFVYHRGGGGWGARAFLTLGACVFKRNELQNVDVSWGW